MSSATTTTPDRQRAPLTARALVAVAGLALAVHAIWPGGVVGRVTYVTLTAGAAAVAAVAARRITGDHARAWRCAAVGLGMSATADVYWMVHETVAPPVPNVSAADPLWLGCYGFLIAAVLHLLRDRGEGTGARIEGFIDTAVSLVVSVLVLWPTAVAPLLHEPSTPLGTRLVWAAYPALDAVLLGLVIRAVVSRQADRRVGLIFVAGVSLWLVSDLGTNLSELTGVAGMLADLGWMAGAGLMGLAARSAAARSRTEPPEGPPPEVVVPGPIAPWRMVAAVLPLLVPVGIELWAQAHGTNAPAPLVGGTVALATLVGLRSMLFLRTRDEAERRLRSSERHFRALAANASDAVIVLSAAGRVTTESDHLATLISRPGTSIVGMGAAEAVYADDVAHVANLYQRALASPGTVFDGEMRLRLDDDQPGPWLAFRLVNLLHDPDVRGVVVNFHDISDRKRAEDELVHLAFYDSLTGLANRALFHDRVDHVVETGAVHDAAVLFLDLDGFKDVNDGLGHDAGDELLRLVSARLLQSARPSDTVARLGGDEFAILLEHTDDPGRAAVVVAERILDELTAPVLLEAGLVTLSASIGIAVPGAAATASSLLRDADIAMYEAKATGRGRWVVYEAAMRAATLERLRLSQDLAEALDADQLHVAYQPVIDLSSGTIVGFEALLRWQHPRLGSIPPDRFIPLAEETGFIKPLGRWVLEQACRTAVRWQEAYGRPDLTIAVNVSARQLASSDLVSHVEDALADSGLAAGCLVLEMTESVLIEDPTTAAGRLRQLRRLGVRLAVDDFGTGYSSLSYLRQFPVDILKIDRSFVTTLADGQAVPAIVHGLLELGHTLGLELVAEGLETAAQLGHLRGERCQLGQGFYFSPPLDPVAAGALLEHRGTLAGAEISAPPGSADPAPAPSGRG